VRARSSFRSRPVRVERRTGAPAAGLSELQARISQPFYATEVLDQPATRIYTPADFPRFEVEPAQPTTRKIHKDSVDQSAVDWGLACAAAEDGKTRPEIEALIISRRQGITPLKPKLESYAERTARNAEERIQAR
jgi:hypothetical protein